MRRAMAVEDRPSLIVLRSHIGWPSPHLTDTAKAHGDPFPEDEIRATKEILGLPPDETFWVPDEVLELYRRCVPRGKALRAEWQGRLRPLRGRPGGLGRQPGRPGTAGMGGQAADLRGRVHGGHPQAPSTPASGHRRPHPGTAWPGRPTSPATPA